MLVDEPAVLGGDHRHELRHRHAAVVGAGVLGGHDQVDAVRAVADLGLDPVEVDLELRSLWPAAPSTPIPPAFETATTTSRQWVKARIGTSIPNISVMAVFIEPSSSPPDRRLPDRRTLARTASIRGRADRCVDQSRVVDVPALGDDEAEVLGRAA